MKITGIDIGEYRQFKNIKFDFSYPKGHSKEGQPLEKICFIGQSGTGKTTLLNIIWDFFRVVNDGYQLLNNRFLVSSVDQYNTFKKISIHTNVDERSVSFGPSNLRQPSELHVNNDKDIAGSSMDWMKAEAIYDTIKLNNKVCLYIDDLAINQARNLTSYKSEDSNKSYVASTDEIFLANEKKEVAINRIEQSKLIAINSFDSNYLWSYLLKDIEIYDENLKKIAIELINNNNRFSPNRLSESLNKWQIDNPNPKVDIAINCLNPILENFFLEVDTEGTEALIVIRTRSGKQLSFNGLSGATKQLLVTAIPIYKGQINNGVVLFDEPERSLFPDIQRDLIKYYTGLAPEAQFCFATHSPIIASAFEPCERFILYFDENGGVNCRNGVAPEGDDPNDVLRQDFDMSPLMLDKGIEEYERYRQLGAQIRVETDSRKKNELITERARLGDLYNF